MVTTNKCEIKTSLWAWYKQVVCFTFTQNVDRLEYMHQLLVTTDVTDIKVTFWTFQKNCGVYRYKKNFIRTEFAARTIRDNRAAQKCGRFLAIEI